MRAVQNLVVAAPLDEQDLRDLLYTALQHDGPFAVRYPRGQATGMALRDGFEAIPIGKGRKIRDGADLAFVTYGAIGEYAIEACERLAAEGVEAAHYDLRFVKPIDATLLTEVFGRHSRVVTVEDGVRDGGAGSAVVEWASDAGVLDGTRVVRLGLPDRFVEHGSQRQLHDEVGIGPDGIVRAARSLLGAEVEAA
jgi:1-deoxy-D-xylulose-5-phosphate synthase